MTRVAAFPTTGDASMILVAYSSSGTYIDSTFFGDPAVQKHHHYAARTGDTAGLSVAKDVAVCRVHQILIEIYES